MNGNLVNEMDAGRSLEVTDPSDCEERRGDLAASRGSSGFLVEWDSRESTRGCWRLFENERIRSRDLNLGS